MKKRQIISLALAGAMSLGLLAGCGSADDTTTASGTTERAIGQNVLIKTVFNPDK